MSRLRDGRNDRRQTRFSARVSVSESECSLSADPLECERRTIVPKLHRTALGSERLARRSRPETVSRGRSSRSGHSSGRSSRRSTGNWRRETQFCRRSTEPAFTRYGAPAPTILAPHSASGAMRRRHRNPLVRCHFRVCCRRPRLGFQAAAARGEVVDIHLGSGGPVLPGASALRIQDHASLGGHARANRPTTRARSPGAVGHRPISDPRDFKHGRQAVALTVPGQRLRTNEPHSHR